MKIILLVMLLSFVSAASAIEIEAKMLANGSAILLIDGAQHMLREGARSPEGVLLVSANGKQAIVEVEGKKRTIQLTRRISTQFAKADKAEVRIPSSNGGHYRASGLINGKAVNYLVDTGATTIAMNYREAERLGIAYRGGMIVNVSTANGLTQAYLVNLESVSVGNILIHQVAAAVSTTDSPTEILLGNSYLSKVDLKIDQGVLVLKER